MILPGVYKSIAIPPEFQTCDDWLEWDPKSSTTKFKTTVNGVKGWFIGEYGGINDERYPNGRGIFEQSDKFILGYLKNGKW